MDKSKPNTSQDNEVRKGPWTMEEDLILMNYIANHGEGVWNSLAKAAGLKRTGKSCRLRWLNYLRPDVRRGNITPEEELLIMELHAKWGNRWSKIVKHLPGRTDNEIKNYWRTKIQKHINKHRAESSTSSRHSSTDHHNHHKQHEQASSSQISNDSTTNNYSNYVPATTASIANDRDRPQPYLASISSSSPSLTYPDHHHHHHQAAMDYQAAGYMNTAPAHMNMQMQMHNAGANNNEYNFWGIPEEDFWSVQLFNGE
ncbi:hypothetical protein Cgig2_017570 [Carnegiea gigantea]|uniref:Uncharacterized protein n=1 Tax=Carnegiea gigantea TaxID=171969 RepID=A0A9Q1QKH9_9CARY|nr:hypothetical protein Cgig2_017570 [Carnegiea gigantea]